MKNANIKKVLILGSGALKIGEAGEFDYSGSQALKAMKEENILTVLVNPNIATVQTSTEIADTIYFLPVSPYFVEKIIEKERPQGILLAFGGQTALNCGVDLYKNGVLEKYKIQVLGTPVQTIIDTEDREIFANKLREINIKTPRSIAVRNVDEALDASTKLGFPIIVRAAYTLGGQGSGFCSNRKELKNRANTAFSYSPQILIEESLRGWKEVEYEVVRDIYDNCITVCNMENLDPLGIHTGESIVVAPSQTLTNSEYHKLRSLSLQIIRHLGVIGECNVQYALAPDSEDYRVIEVNARLSRSSALASKATGYPLAFIAAKLALGYPLYELKNAVTQTTTACFEPALDYVVCKFPRWDLDKFWSVSKEIGSSMKSVGEVMAIGRTMEEAIQKGLRMIGQGMHGFLGNNLEKKNNIEQELIKPTDKRIFAIAQALEEGYSVNHIHQLTAIDKWFLDKLKNLVKIKHTIQTYDRIEDVPYDLLNKAKIYGFSDFQLTRFIYKQTNDIEKTQNKVRRYRKSVGIVPYVKQIDTLAAEYPTSTNYLYLTYSACEHDISYVDNYKAIVVLGSGAYRIGSSVEFDWCSVNAIETVKEAGLRAVMVNYNPETVSTDYDICDRLYFEELTFERVLDIVELENPSGTILSVGGQIPNNLAMRLYKANVKILGTSPLSIDRAENRKKFSAMLDTLKISQPEWAELTSIEAIHEFIEKVGFPILIRPSYVLSGAAMNVVSNIDELKEFLDLAVSVSKQYPVVVSEFIERAKEIEFDAVAKDGEVVCHAISEHIEFAGVHSGDATLIFPPQKIYFESIRKIRKIARKIADELNINGPFNIQVLAKDNYIKVIECNLRASRSFPFVSKVLGFNFIKEAIKIALNLPISKKNPSMFELEHIGVKSSQFSFTRLSKADPILGVNMSSTGEVGCLGDSYYDAVLKAMLSVGYRIPCIAVLISSGPIQSKVDLLDSAKMLKERGLTLYATGGSADFLIDNYVHVTHVDWPDEKSELTALDLIKNKMVDLVINIPKNLSKPELDNDYIIRRSAIDYNIPLLTNARLARAFINAFCKKDLDSLQISSWNEYLYK